MEFTAPNRYFQNRLLPGKVRRIVRPLGRATLKEAGPESVNRRGRVVEPGKALSDAICGRRVCKRFIQVETSAFHDMMLLWG